MKGKVNLHNNFWIAIITLLYVGDFIGSSQYLESSSPIYAVILVPYILSFKLNVSNKIHKILVWSYIILLIHSITQNTLTGFQNIILPHLSVIKLLIISYCKIYITISMVKYLFTKEIGSDTSINWQTIISITIIILLYVADFLVTDEYLRKSSPNIMLMLSLVYLFEHHLPIPIQRMLICSLLINVTTQLTPSSFNSFFDDLSIYLPTIKLILVFYFKIKITLLMVKYLIDKKKSRA